MFDNNHDGYIDMRELRQVTVMLGTMLTKEEVEEFMAEADKVWIQFYKKQKMIAIKLCRMEMASWTMMSL